MSVSVSCVCVCVCVCVIQIAGKMDNSNTCNRLLSKISFFIQGRCSSV